MRKYILSLLFFLTLCVLISFSYTEAGGSELHLEKLEKQINEYRPDNKYKDDPFALVTIKEALIAAKEGNYGIGACLIREVDGSLVEKGHNEVFVPYFRSDRHAEMVTMTKYENSQKTEKPNVDGLVLFTSLECCPMCLTRLISAGVPKVYYVASDPIAGMIHLYDNMPPLWQVIAIGRQYGPAECSPELKKLANEIFLLTRETLDEKLK